MHNPDEPRTANDRPAAPPSPGGEGRGEGESSRPQGDLPIPRKPSGVMNPTDWENRYQTGDMPWEKGEPSPGLVDFLAAHRDLEKGTVCVPGCGTGHDARAWSRAGFRVLGLDIAPSAVRTAAQWTRAAGLEADFQLSDFLRDSPK